VFDIREGDLSDIQVRDLLALHLASMHDHSPPGSVFALDLSGLQVAEVTVWTAWRGSSLAGVGALKMLADGNGEVKSMRTHPDFLRMGAAATILEMIIAAASARGARQLSLETGSGPAFEPALALYRRRGFHNGTAFSTYRPSDFNQFLHLDLTGALQQTSRVEERNFHAILTRSRWCWTGHASNFLRRIVI
jgi:putative acetyltransferase